MLKREQLKDILFTRLSYEVKTCMEKNDSRFSIYQEQLDNLDLYLDEFIAKSVNMIIERIHYLPTEKGVPTGKTTSNGKPTYFQSAGEPLEISSEEFGEYGKNHAPFYEKKFIDMVNDFYGTQIPYKEDYQSAMIAAHTDPTEENMIAFSEIQRRNGDFITWEGLSLLPISNDKLYVSSNRQGRTL